jgi:integrase
LRDGTSSAVCKNLCKNDGGSPTLLQIGASVTSNQKPIDGSVIENEPPPKRRKVKKHADEHSSPAYKLAMKAISIRNEKTVDERQKNFLTEAEVEKFLKSSRHGRHGVRNFAMMLLSYRHALRVSELVNLRLADLDLSTGRLFVRRSKGSLSTSQSMEGDEIRSCRLPPPPYRLTLQIQFFLP